MTLNQIKQEIAALLNVDSVNAKSLFELANSNSVVLTAIQSIDASQFNLRTTETWQAIRNKLKGEGVKEDLSSECGEVTVATVNQSEVVTSTVNTIHQEYLTVHDGGLTENTKYIKLCASYGIKATLPESNVVGVVIDGNYFNLYNLNNYLKNLTKSTSTTVATETKDNVTEFKGIPVEYCDFLYNAKIYIPEFSPSEVLIINDTSPSNEEITYLRSSVHDKVCSFAEAIGTAKKYLEVKQLTPKLYLFTTMTDFVFLLSGFLDLMDLFDTSAQYASEFNLAVTKMYQMWESISYILYGCYTSPKQTSYQCHLKFVDYWKQVSNQIA